MSSDENELKLQRQRSSLFQLELRLLTAALCVEQRSRCTNEFIKTFAGTLKHCGTCYNFVFPYSDALADGTIFTILRELRDVQVMTEKQLQQSYDDMLLNQDRQRRNLQHQTAMGWVWGRNRACYALSFTYSRPNRFVEFDRQHALTLKQNQMRVIMELDALLTQQQVAVLSSFLTRRQRMRPAFVRALEHIFTCIGNFFPVGGMRGGVRAPDVYDPGFAGSTSVRHARFRYRNQSKACFHCHHLG
ncbi:unnamed protein product [Sphagnum balticum]